MLLSRNTYIVVIYLMVLSLLPNCSSNKAPAFDLIITNVNLIDGTGSPLQSGMNVYIRDGRIQAITQTEPQQSTNRIDGTGKYLMAVKGGAKNHVHFVGIDIDWENEEHRSAMQTVRDRNGSIITTLMIDKSFIYPLHPEWLEIPQFNAVYPLEELQTMRTPKNIRFAKMMAEMTKRDYGLDTLTLKTLFAPKVKDIQHAMDMGVNMVLGTDTGNRFNFHGYSLHEEMQIFEEGGMEPMDIIRMGTINAARMLNAQDSLGTLQVGKLADMILLTANPLETVRNTLSIDSVFKNGKVQRSKYRN